MQVTLAALLALSLNTPACAHSAMSHMATWMLNDAIIVEASSLVKYGTEKKREIRRRWRQRRQRRRRRKRHRRFSFKSISIQWQRIEYAVHIDALNDVRSEPNRNNRSVSHWLGYAKISCFEAVETNVWVHLSQHGLFSKHVVPLIFVRSDREGSTLSNSPVLWLVSHAGIEPCLFFDGNEDELKFIRSFQKVFAQTESDNFGATLSRWQELAGTRRVCQVERAVIGNQYHRLMDLHVPSLTEFHYLRPSIDDFNDVVWGGRIQCSSLSSPSMTLEERHPRWMLVFIAFECASCLRSLEIEAINPSPRVFDRSTTMAL